MWALDRCSALRFVSRPVHHEEYGFVQDSPLYYGSVESSPTITSGTSSIAGEVEQDCRVAPSGLYFEADRQLRASERALRSWLVGGHA